MEENRESRRGREKRKGMRRREGRVSFLIEEKRIRSGKEGKSKEKKS